MFGSKMKLEWDNKALSIFNGICEFDGFIFLLMSFASKPIGLLMAIASLKESYMKFAWIHIISATLN
jgi:hypothetical protein